MRSSSLRMDLKFIFLMHKKLTNNFNAIDQFYQRRIMQSKKSMKIIKLLKNVNTFTLDVRHFKFK